jgi:hypothetical protein
VKPEMLVDKTAPMPLYPPQIPWLFLVYLRPNILLRILSGMVVNYKNCQIPCSQLICVLCLVISAIFNSYYPYICISLQMSADTEKAHELDLENAEFMADEDHDPLKIRTELT